MSGTHGGAVEGPSAALDCQDGPVGTAFQDDQGARPVTAEPPAGQAERAELVDLAEKVMTAASAATSSFSSWPI